MRAIRDLNNQDLLLLTRKTAQHERTQILTVLECFVEVEARKLFAANYPSLFAWATEELLYSEGEAQRRIDGARALRDFPELGPRISSGGLNLSHLCKVRRFLRAETKLGRKFAPNAERDLYFGMEGISARDADIWLASQMSSPKKPRDGERRLNAKEVAVTFTADIKLQKDLRRLKEVWAHKLPGPSWTELIAEMTDELLERHDPLKKAERSARRKSEPASSDVHVNCMPPDSDVHVNCDLPKFNASMAGESPATIVHVTSEPPIEILDTGEAQYCFPRAPVPAVIKHQVWRRDRGQCTHVGENGKRCPSRYGLEIDHEISVALGGTNELSNLTLKCREHNLYAAYRVFGRAHMERKIWENHD